MERDIVAAIVRSAKKQGWWIMKIHGGPYQPAGIPDLLLVKEGRALWLEVKQPGKKPTAIQEQRMKEIFTTGGSPCYVVTSREEADRLMQSFFREGDAADHTQEKSRKAVTR